MANEWWKEWAEEQFPGMNFWFKPDYPSNPDKGMLYLNVPPLTVEHLSRFGVWVANDQDGIKVQFEIADPSGVAETRYEMREPTPEWVEDTTARLKDWARRYAAAFLRAIGEEA